MLDPGYLLDAAEHGDERTRFQFVKARIIFSRIPELEGTVTSIAVYPENERIEKMEATLARLRQRLSNLRARSQAVIKA